MLLAARSLSAHVQSFLPSHRGSLSLARCVLIPSSTKQENERTETGRIRRGIKRDAPRDETTRSPTRRGRWMTETIHGGQASNKTTDETEEHETGGARHPLMRTNGRQRRRRAIGAVPLLLASTTTRTRRDDRGIPFIISPDPLSPAPLSSADLILSPAPGRGMSKQEND